MGTSIFEDLGHKAPKKKQASKGFLSRNWDSIKTAYQEKQEHRKDLKTAYKEAYRGAEKQATRAKARKDARERVNRGRFSGLNRLSVSPSIRRAQTQEYEKKKPKSNMEKMLGL